MRPSTAYRFEPALHPSITIAREDCDGSISHTHPTESVTETETESDMPPTCGTQHQRDEQMNQRRGAKMALPIFIHHLT